jgi:hypothetical protein
MFLLTVFVYPTVLALLCAGAGLLVDRIGRPALPAALIPLAGMAALIGITQLSTWIAWVAPASPWIVAVIAMGGLLAGRDRIGELALALRTRAGARAQVGLVVLAYLIAIAPVLLGGRTSFSSYMVLTDSSIHMIGADYLISHGANFGGLDLRNSYGQLVNDYFNSGYPSGADTLFGASSFLLRLPLIWSFQPFNAFALALGVGPAWLLVRRLGLGGVWAGLAALTITLPALVYAYELIASVKEIVALPILLGIGYLVLTHRRWLMAGVRAGILFALLAAAGVSALGLGFGAWVLVALAVLAAIGGAAISQGRWTPAGAARLLGSMGLTVLVFGWPTWARGSSSVSVSTSIASASNPGNLVTPLRPVQTLGIWLSGSYLHPPTGHAALLTDALAAVIALAALVGVANLLRLRRFALSGWLLGSLAASLALYAYGTTWVDAKVLMLSSPLVMLAAWAGVAALRQWRPAPQARQLVLGALVLAGAVAAAIAGGVLLSDAAQYHDSELAPTARYDEMASLNARFAGRGPTLFTDFDEYSMYVLRSLDIGGPDFLNAPPALIQTSKGHGHTVDLERAKPAALAGYPAIVTRINPLAYRPPAAYRLLWQGSYYQVWGRIRGARPALLASGLQAPHREGCALARQMAQVATAHHAELVVDSHPEVIQIGLPALHHTAGWYRHGIEFVMDTAGRLWATFSVPRSGVYKLWLQGEAMPTLRVQVDGRRVGSVGGEVSGNGDSPDPMVPIRVRLGAGRHTLAISRSGFSLAPGSGSEAYLQTIAFTPAGAAGLQHLSVLPAGRWHSLCGTHIDWIEVVSR